jgi:uncharacterized protein
MHPFAALAEAEETLRALAAAGLVEELPRSPGQKERRWRQLLGGATGTPASAAVVPAPAPAAPEPPPPARVPGRDPTGDRLAALERQVAELARRLERLERGGTGR